jgi:glycine/sarcosine N-methyltransferase
MSVEGETPLYDALSDDYDRFVNWESRLAYEMPFIEGALREVDARRVLDVACGTGMHAIELARRSYKVVGTDLSALMIEQARENAAAAEVEARFVVAGFGELAEKLALSPVLSEVEGTVKEGGDLFDAVLCLGNSLPHALGAEDLDNALVDFAAVLRPGGLLLVQNRNFDAVLASRERFMGPEAHREGDREWLFVRFYDFNSDSTLTFNMLILRRDAEGKWSQQVEATELHPITHSELIASLIVAGFTNIVCYGDMQGSPFDLNRSPNLVVTAQRKA